VHLHHGTGDVLARISLLDRTSVDPNAAALVGVAAAAPLPLCRGDRFVLRDASAQRTIAGGIVLDIDPPARYRRAPARLALLAALRDDAPAVALTAWLAVEPVAVARLRAGWNLGEDDAAALLAANAARVFAGTAFSPAAWDELGATIIAAVAATHEREPEMPGLEQNRLRRIVGARIETEAFAGVVDDLLARGLLLRRGAFVALPTHTAELAHDERMRWERIKPLLADAPFCPPRVRDIARHVNSPEGDVRSLLRKVARVGEVTLVALDHFFLTEAVAALADRASELGAADGIVRAAPFRDRIGGGRKVAIQILEFFDRSGYTRRIRDDHLIRRDNPWRATQQERR
jgi:selenocysteine-specific elongation factor